MGSSKSYNKAFTLSNSYKQGGYKRAYENL